MRNAGKLKRAADLEALRVLRSYLILKARSGSPAARKRLMNAIDECYSG